MKNSIFIICCFLLSTFTYAQVGIGTITPESSAILELKGTDNALLVTRVANTAAITSPVNGMVIYDLSSDCIRFYQNNVWSDCVTATGSGSGSVTALNCGSASKFGTLIRNESANGVSVTIPYTGGNGNPHNGQTVNSTGVTGLTATLPAGSFASGSGSLSYTITGTPAMGGTASFAISIGGQSCTITMDVNLGTIRIAQINNYSLGSSIHPEFRAQMLNSIYYGLSGTYNKMRDFAFIDITATIGTYTPETLKANFDIVSTGAPDVSDDYTATVAQLLKDYVDLGGIYFALFEENRNTEILKAFNGTGGGLNSSDSASSDFDLVDSGSPYYSYGHTGVFGNSTLSLISGDGTNADIPFTSVPSSAISLTSSTAKGGVWLYGSDKQAIFFWDEGVFKDDSVYNTISSNQEKYLHNLLTYTLDKLFVN